MEDFERTASRVLITLALLRLSTRELAELKRLLEGSDPALLQRRLRILEEDMAENAAVSLDSFRHRETDFSQEIEDRMRSTARDLGVPNAKFVDLLTRASLDLGRAAMPPFDAKKGFRQWIVSALRTSSPSELLQLASVVLNNYDKTTRSWQLR